MIFVNDLYLNVYNSDCILFADDTTLFKTHSDIGKTILELQKDINQLTDCFQADQLSLNVTKSNLMVFGNKNKLSIKIDNIDIPLVDSTKFLGIHLDPSLNLNLNTSIHLNTSLLISNLISNRYMLQITKKYARKSQKVIILHTYFKSY